MDKKTTSAIIIDRERFIYLEITFKNRKYADALLNFSFLKGSQKSDDNYIVIDCRNYARTKGAVLERLNDLDYEYTDIARYEERRKARRKKRGLANQHAQLRKEWSVYTTQLPKMWEGTMSNWAEVPDNFIKDGRKAAHMGWPVER